MFKLFLANLKILTRDRELLFWSMMFPLMFTFIFGFFFGKGSTTTGTVALINKANTEISQNFDKAINESKLFKIQLPYPPPTLEKILKLARNQQPINAPRASADVVLSGWVKRARRQLYEPKETKVKNGPSNFGQNISPDVEELLKGVGEGSRNSTCFYLACYLLAKGFTEFKTRQRLLDFGARCSPPLNEREVEITLQSGLKPRPL